MDALTDYAQEHGGNVVVSYKQDGSGELALWPLDYKAVALHLERLIQRDVVQGAQGVQRLMDALADYAEAHNGNLVVSYYEGDAPCGIAVWPVDNETVQKHLEQISGRMMEHIRTIRARLLRARYNSDTGRPVFGV